MTDEETDGTVVLRAAVAVLDEHGPDNWRDKINPVALNMADYRLCVLGQLYGDYGIGLFQLLRAVGSPWPSPVWEAAFHEYFPVELWREELAA